MFYVKVTIDEKEKHKQFFWLMLMEDEKMVLIRRKSFLWACKMFHLMMCRDDRISNVDAYLMTSDYESINDNPSLIYSIR